MTETSYARARRAALLGLAVQVLAFGGTLALAFITASAATFQLSWYVLGGVPLWFATLLIFRQHELAALERLDLEQLRREKQAGGGGEALFGAEGAAGLGFLVAETRLRWMQRWLLPSLALLAALYLIVVGYWRWQSLALPVGDARWISLMSVPIGMITLSVIMLVLFYVSRYASGMGRVSEWQLLRGCGAFMLGNAIVALVVIVCLGANLYARVATWEHVLAYAIPVVMVVLGLETLLNFIFDIYRPRTPGTEPRAAFDSRLLGLFSEPGGLAYTIAEAINYQFGFKVSQTWFYQLMQRAILPLLWVGALALWALSCVVIVQPFERAVLLHWGRLINADAPLGPGLHLKAPWPIAVAQKYNTGQLHQIIIGVKNEGEPVRSTKDKPSAVELWTDAEHGGYEHFDFLVSPAAGRQPEPAPTTAPAGLAAGADERARAVPVHLIRMHVVVQYRIQAERLAEHVTSVEKPDDALRDIAWEEVVRFNAASDVDSLLGARRVEAGEDLRKRIAARAAERRLGLEIVYVGLQNIHPEKTVAEAFRRVISAEQEKGAAVRQARVKENEILAGVAGDKFRALALAQAVEKVQNLENELDRAAQAVRDAGVSGAALDALRREVAALRPQFAAVVERVWREETATQQFREIRDEYELGLGRSASQLQTASAEMESARQAADEARADLAVAVDRLRGAGDAPRRGPAVDALAAEAAAQVGLDFWRGRLEAEFRDLQGQAAVVLAKAQADRWLAESRAASEFVRLENERAAYRTAPRVYQARRYLETFARGIADSRKYLLAFDPRGRSIRTRLETQEQARPDLAEPNPTPP